MIGYEAKPRCCPLKKTLGHSYLCAAGDACVLHSLLRLPFRRWAQNGPCVAISNAAVSQTLEPLIGRTGSPSWLGLGSWHTWTPSYFLFSVAQTENVAASARTSQRYSTRNVHHDGFPTSRHGSTKRKLLRYRVFVTRWSTSPLTVSDRASPGDRLLANITGVGAAPRLMSDAQAHVLGAQPQ